MRFSFWLRNWKRSAPAARRRTQMSPRQRDSFRPLLEILEARNLLSAPVSTTDGLVAAITTANSSGGATTITLASDTTFDFTSANNSTNGANALPVITGNITIAGSGATIERTGSTAFRLFDVASGGSLTLQDLTLQGGEASGALVAAEGGAIFSSGTLNLSAVLVQGNQAVGANGASAGANGADAFGGGVYVAGGSVSLINDTLSGNSAQGGTGAAGAAGVLGGGIGGSGGNGNGGGLGVEDAKSVSLINDTLSGNSAQGGAGGTGGNALGTTHVPGIGGNGGAGGNGTGGGLYLLTNSNVTLTNTLIAENNVAPGTFSQPGQGGLPGNPGSNGTTSAPDVNGTVNSSDHNLIGNADGSTGFSAAHGDLLGTTANPLNPQLGPLQNNGGLTQTMALLPGSPAINAGDNSAQSVTGLFDQRGPGFARVSGGTIDIGAFEVQLPPPPGGGGSGGTSPSPAPPTLHTPPLLAFFDALLRGIETVNSNETETVTDSIFGFPLIVSLYDGAGNLLSVTLFGIDVTFLFESL
jgi:hypothetical protein